MTRPGARVAGGLLLAVAMLCGCGGNTGSPPAMGPSTAGESPPATSAAGEPSPGTSTAGPSAEEPPSGLPVDPPTSGSDASPTAPTDITPAPPQFRAANALRDIETLAVDIGPRHATSRAFRAAAVLVQERFETLGFDVRRESVAVPAGNSWGTPVSAGTSRNVIAQPPGFDARAPHVVVVAHLDTVPVAPGAEDNASGISVMLELARLAAASPPDVPVRFIAFGAEEPRGSGDSLHHFGSQQHVAGLSRAQRSAILGVVALDRVGVRASAVPVCTALPSGNQLRADMRAAARKVDVPTRACSGNTTSDHWSYAKAGISAIRLGSVPYAGYHSARDTPEVIDRRQVNRVGRAMWAWLQGLR